MAAIDGGNGTDAEKAAAKSLIEQVNGNSLLRMAFKTVLGLDLGR